MIICVHFLTFVLIYLFLCTVFLCIYTMLGVNRYYVFLESLFKNKAIVTSAEQQHSILSVLCDCLD